MPGQDGVEGFMASLTEWGASPEIRQGVVVYTVRAPEGALQGEEVATAVSVSELEAWPAVPPHFVHFTADVKIEPVYDNSDTLPGWARHSRQIQHWETTTEPGRTWLAHVRSVVAKAA